MKKRPTPDWMEDYIEGKLEGARLEEAEAELAGSPELQRLVAIERELPRALGGASAMRSLAEEVAKGGRTRRSNTWQKPVFIAAALVSLAVIAILAGQLFKKSPTVEEIVFARYFNPETISPNGLRSINEEVSSEIARLRLDSLQAFYTEKNYPEAIRIMQVLRPEVEEKYLSNFNLDLGKLYLLTGDAKKAVEALERVQVGAVSEKSWYLAMAFLLSGDRPEAEARLRTIATTEGHPYQESAARALEELRGKVKG
jgi:hypothetical protein